MINIPTLHLSSLYFTVTVAIKFILSSMVQFASPNGIIIFCLCFKATEIKFTPNNMTAFVFNAPLL